MTEGVESSELEASERSTASAMAEAEAREGYKWVQLGPKSIEIPEEWTVSLLSNMSDINMGSSPSSEYYNESQNGLPFFQGNANFGHRYPTPEVWCTKPDKVAEEGDILISVRAPVGELNFANTDCCIGRGLAAIGGTNSDSEFMFYSLLYSRQRLESYAQGSTFDSVNSKVLQNFPVVCPKLPEQRRIAEILSTVDEQIQQTKSIIETTEELKRGLREELILGGISHSDHREFRVGPFEYEIPSGWGDTTVSECAKNLDSQRIPVKKQKREEMVGDIPYYGASGQIDSVDDWLFDDDLLLLAEDGENLLSRNTPISFATSGKVWVNNHAHVLKPNPDMNLEYLLNYFEILSYRPYATGTAQPKLNQKVLNSLRVPKPAKHEQDKIARILNNVSDVIREKYGRKKKLQDLRRGLMQDLLTGTVRVPKSIEAED